MKYGELPAKFITKRFSDDVQKIVDNKWWELGQKDAIVVCKNLQT